MKLEVTKRCVASGFATSQFNLGRGVRHGCPLSGILFIIGIEIQENAIRRPNEIKGIEINERSTLKTYTVCR